MSRVFRRARRQVVDNGGNPFENNLHWRREAEQKWGGHAGGGLLCVFSGLMERAASRVGVCGPASTSG
jgi:hypothetical protein